MCRRKRLNKQLLWQFLNCRRSVSESSPSHFKFRFTYKRLVTLRATCCGYLLLKACPILGHSLELYTRDVLTETIGQWLHIRHPFLLPLEIAPKYSQTASIVMALIYVYEKAKTNLNLSFRNFIFQSQFFLFLRFTYHFAICITSLHHVDFNPKYRC